MLQSINNFLYDQNISNGLLLVDPNTGGVEKAEYSFRKFLRKKINEIKGTQAEKKIILKLDKKYNWIPKIYPTVFTDEYKIIFLSINKLILKNDTLIKPSYRFLSSDVLKNSIFFIDEFDATKDTITEAIIKDAIDSQNDYLEIVKELHSKLHDYKPAKDFYQPYEEYCKNKPYGEGVLNIYKRPGEPESSKKEKDFDGIYLGDITHIVTARYNRKFRFNKSVN